MKVLCYDLKTGVAGLAVRDAGHDLVGYIMAKPTGDIARHSTATRIIQKTLLEPSPADVLVTSCPLTLSKRVKTMANNIGAKHILWDLGNTKMRKSDLNLVSVPLQIAGYEVTLIKGISISALGYNYKEDRWFLWATTEGISVLPPKLQLKTPFMLLEDILDTDGDPLADPIWYKGKMFHKEPRPWTFLGKVYSDTHLKHHPLSTVVGSVWYLWEGKRHRIRPYEAASLAGVPIGVEEQIITSCPNDAMATYVMLKDAGYPVWLDMLERTIGYENSQQ
jgi:hypothetical protein